MVRLKLIALQLEDFSRKRGAIDKILVFGLLTREKSICENDR